jgi:glycosyltransferase involved in cell wall biosynthesis
MHVLRRAVLSVAPDVVSVHCARRWAPYAVALRRLTKVPQVLNLQEGALPADVPDHRRLFRMLARAADAVAACSREAARYAEDVGGAARVRVIPNGYDPGEFANGRVFAHPTAYLLGVGRLDAQKGFDVLVDAFARLASPELELLLAGDGAERPALEALARRLGVADRVRFLGTTDRATTVALYRGAAIVACPSRFEGMPLVCLEALAAARPLVGSAVNGIPELVRDGETGVLVPPADPRALATALRRLLDAPAEARRMADAGRRWVEREHPWPAVANAYLALCAEVARR